MRREFTGRDMTIVLVTGFGIIIAVNLLMATFAVRGFGGVVVENSYVASQKFNGWLNEAERQRALGWSATLRRDATERLEISTSGVPVGAQVSAILRRPLGKPETTAFDVTETSPGHFVSDAPVPKGRWLIRLTVRTNSETWQQEGRIE